MGVRSCPFSLCLKANRMSRCGGWSPLVSGFLVDGWVRVSLAYGHFLESHCRILLIPYLSVLNGSRVVLQSGLATKVPPVDQTCPAPLFS